MMHYQQLIQIKQTKNVCADVGHTYGITAQEQIRLETLTRLCR